MNIREIANEINERSKKHLFGEFQNLRKKIKGLNRKASSKIFTDQTISNDGWAFHCGGRKEIQFNIGFENESFRYGLAFSLVTSRSLTDLRVLYPKILKINALIRNEPELFKDYRMWHYKGERSDITGVHEIGTELVQGGTFIFIGKLMNTKEINFDEILSTFHDLLNIYQEVEIESEKIIETTKKKDTFIFNNKSKILPGSAIYSPIEREINIDARHTYLQEKLYDHLVSIFGKDAVSLENPINGNRIDIVVENSKNSYIFYEIKTGSSAKSCIRQAIGQLFEYAFWNRQEFNVELVVAGEFELDKTTSEYIWFLKNTFNIPISYHCIK
ncbi:hypothetical protein L0B52_05700 [Suttonella sp. R2A3]|uniref:hypothetical protein n=1 Tax=Suttonella sp. R2A3 TaxID=2908648 RepID=UPI001F441F7C|nr:hypothetical protein [Suttonella sp. R2A3]UJF23842.1 hypothetical protein L0B52_05700 [Suttonella sp. R2A3]